MFEAISFPLIIVTLLACLSMASPLLGLVATLLLVNLLLHTRGRA